MNATHLGFYNTATTRTHVRFQFSTHAAAGGNVAPNSAFEAADLRIYKAADGAAFSNVQRSSANGITMTSPFDTLTGVHDVDIDLTDNTDASFYAAGSLYSIMLAPDETVDSQTLTGVVLAYFEIGVAKADVTQFGGTAGAFASGRPEVNTTHAAGTAWGSGAITAAAIASDAITDAKVASDVTIASVTGAVGSVTGAVGSVTGNVGGNVTGSVGSVVGAVGSVTGSVGSVTGLTASNLDATISSRASATNLATAQTSIDDLPTNAELATSQAAADDATLSAIAALNNLSSAQAQTAAAAALTAYDPPTNTEMEARTLAAASYATAASQTTIAGYIDTEVAAIITSLAALNNISAADVLTQVNSALQATLADSIPADGTRPSISSGIYMLVQFMLERSVSGTTCTVRKPDGSTSLFTLTLNDATSPTSITRA